MSQSALETSAVGDVSQAVRPTRRRMRVPRWLDHVAKWIVLGLGEAVAVVLGVALAWLAAMNLLIARGGADVTALVPNAQAWFAEAYQGREAEIGSLRLVVDAERGELGLLGQDIRVLGEDETLADVARLDARFGMAQALGGRVDLLGLEVDGGALTIRRDAGGKHGERWVAGLGTPGNLGRLGPLVTLGGEARARPPITVRNATLHFSDQVDGLELRLEDAALDVAAGLEARGRVSGTLYGGGTGVPIAASVLPEGTGSVARIRATGLRPSDFAAQRGRLAALRDADIALDVDVMAARTENGRVGDVTLAISGADGTVQLDGRGVAVQALEITGVVNPDERSFSFDVGEIATDVITTRGAVSGDWKNGMRGSFNLDSLAVDAGEPLGRLVFASPRGELAWSPDAANIALTDTDFGIVGVRFAGDMGVGLEGRRATALDLDLAMTGELSPEALLRLWPENAIGGARRWIARAILGGTVENLTLRAALEGEELRGAPIPDEKLRLAFDVRNGEVKYISTMTPLVDAVGRGVLQGNRFDFALEAGRVGPLGVRRATVEMPRVVPKGGPLIISVSGEGDATEMLRLIDQEPFRYATRYNLDPAEFAGRGAVDVVIRRPLREFITPDQVSYEISGAFTDVTVPFRLAGQTLTDGHIALEADAGKLSLSGPVSFGAWRADMSYLDVLGDDGSAPTISTLRGVVSRDALDGFGIGLRQYFDGDVPVDIRAVSDGLALVSAEVEADLTGVVLSLDPYWAKPYGIASTLTADIGREGTTSIIEDLRITAPGMEVSGDVVLREDMALERMRLERLAIRDVMDIRLDLAPDAGRTKLVAEVSGSFLDLSPAVEERLRGTREAGGLPLELSGALERLRVAEGYELADARVRMSSVAAGVERADVSGTVEGAPLLATIAPNGTGRELRLELPDASGAAEALFGFTGTRGGATRVSASLPAVGEPGAVIGEVEVEELTLTRAPVLAQILSLASLTGLGDTLSGQGLTFSDIDMEFAYREGRLSLRRTRANGAALGLTVEGEVQLAEQRLDLNGVLVPAYRANSLLQSIPLVGDILVGKKGEGVLSLSWSVNGPYGAAQVAVNPLSALTPGVLRGIFDPQREGLEESVGESDLPSP